MSIYCAEVPQVSSDWYSCSRCFFPVKATPLYGSGVIWELYAANLGIYLFLKIYIKYDQGKGSTWLTGRHIPASDFL